MKYVCKWCETELPQSQDDGTERVSHGICIPCALKELPKHLHAEFLRKRGLEREGFTVSAGRCF